MNVVIIVIKNYHVQNLVIMLLVGPACHVIKMNVIEECHDHLIIIVIMLKVTRMHNTIMGIFEDCHKYPPSKTMMKSQKP